MAKIELSTGTIDYEDTDGPGPVLVLLHGLPTASLASGFRWRARSLTAIGSVQVAKICVRIGRALRVRRPPT